MAPMASRISCARRRQSLGDTDGLAENAFAECRVQGVGGREVHRATKKFAEPPLKADKGEEANPDGGVIVDEEINFASLAGLAPHCRAEHANFLHSVLLEDLAMSL
jgi:hypothetical protein